MSKFKIYFIPLLVAILAGVGLAQSFTTGLALTRQQFSTPAMVLLETTERLAVLPLQVAQVAKIPNFEFVRDFLRYRFGSVDLVSPPSSSSILITATEDALIEQSSELKLRFVGDIMLGRGVASMVQLHGDGDYQWLFNNLESLDEADILFGNLEGPISDRGVDRRNLYSFRFVPETAGVLRDAGFDILSIANNHLGDWGMEAFLDTIERLQDSGIVPVGAGQNKAEAITPQILERQGVKVGFLAFTDVGPDWLVAMMDRPGILLASDPDLSQIINQASGQVDILVVSYHFGDEYQTAPNDRQQRLARLAIDQGAKLVVGHHPHVVQPVEYYCDGLIAYSLGNFIFDQYFSEETMHGNLLEVTLKDGEIYLVKEFEVILNSEYQPSLRLK